MTATCWYQVPGTLVPNRNACVSFIVHATCNKQCIFPRRHQLFVTSLVSTDLRKLGGIRCPSIHLFLPLLRRTSGQNTTGFLAEHIIHTYVSSCCCFAAFTPARIDRSPNQHSRCSSWHQVSRNCYVCTSHGRSHIIRSRVVPNL